MIQWDEYNNVLTDNMGYPLSRTEAEELKKCIDEHLKNSPADLAALALKVTKERYPSMLEQVSFDPERYE